MPEFNLDLDIANRACQHVGVGRISASEWANPTDSKAASEIGFVYGKLRQAELGRNLWTFATKKAVLRPVDIDTMLIAAALWSSTATYFVGSIVADSRGTLWISRQSNNLNNQPELTAAWEPYFGPVTADAWDATKTYFSGELAYTAAGDGTSRVYLSLQNANADNPATATAWAATTTYFKDQVITRSAVAYKSLIDLNLNNDPAAAPALWAIATTYAIGNQVGGSDGVIYTSLTNGNTGNDPTTDAVNWTNTGVLLPWTTVFVGGSGSIKWLQIGGAEFPSGVTLTTLNIAYPIGTGPSSQLATRNVYRLPAGFLRRAPQDPKAGAYSDLGSPSGLPYNDWNIEGRYIVSMWIDPIMLRFVADVTDVTMMHAMFCEGLGARIGLEVCEVLTQSGSKKGTIAQEYARFMGEARQCNAVEVGPVEQPIDDYLACRY